MRQPFRVAREMGWRKFLASYWLLTSAIGSALLHLPCLAWLLVCLFSPDVTFTLAGQWVLVAGYGVSVLSSLLAPNTNWTWRLGLIASFWLYWPLLSLAAARALYELLLTPHLWAKAPHALTPQTPRIDQEVFAGIE